MDFKQIQELIKMINDSNIGEVTIEQKEFKITIRQKEEQITQVVATSGPMNYGQLPATDATAGFAFSTCCSVGQNPRLLHLLILLLLKVR